jgi:hypothetical protein
MDASQINNGDLIKIVFISIAKKYIFVKPMKKSQNIMLSAVFIAAISSCNNHQDDWTYGAGANGRVHDTAVYSNGRYHYYRFYGSGWYLLHRNNMINMIEDGVATTSEISSPSFVPRTASGGIRTGGVGEGAGHGGAGE